MEFQPFVRAVRVFSPATGATIAEHVLPVHSLDAEHAAACCIAVEERR